METWLLAAVKGGRERYAADNVRRQGHEPYLPVFWCERTKQRRALFPSYLFVLSRDGTWSWLESTYGCRRAVQVGESIYKVPPTLITSLKATENKNGVIELPKAAAPTRLKQGDKIRIKDETHTFFGHYGLFQEQSAKRRVSILLSLLGKWVPMALDAKMIEAA